MTDIFFKFCFLSTTKDRLNKIHQQIDREKLKRKALLDTELSTSASHLKVEPEQPAVEQ